MMTHQIVSQQEWVAARTALLEKEKALTRELDALSAERRALPWVRVEKAYEFDAPEGKVTLGDLFAGRSQLFIQHFMLAPGEKEGCIGCSFSADHVDGARQHFEHNDLSFAAVARAPIHEIEAYRKRMGWAFRFVSSFNNNFNYDFHVSFKPEEIASGKVYYNYRTMDARPADLPGASVFVRDETGGIFHTYSAFARGDERALGAYMFLDMTPKGRNETGPHRNLMDWVKRHDEYANAQPVAARCCDAA
jgi:predicted dithiol-disulfide oxidoreductase (DUF899 family)